MGKKHGLVLILTALCLSFLNMGVSYGAVDKVAKWEIDLGIESSQKNPIKLFLEDKQILTGAKDVKPVIVKGTTLIPARAIFESMGYTVTWVQGEKAVLIKGVDNEIKLVVNSETALVDQVEYKLGVPATIIDFNKDGKGSTMIPLRFTAEAIGCNVKWIAEERKVVVIPPIPISGNEHLYQAGDAQTKPNTGTSDKPANSGTVKPEVPSVTPNNITEQDEKELAKKLVAPFVDLSVDWQGEKLNPAAAEKIIVIDIGHGAHDTGAIGHKGKPDEYTEKEANMLAGTKLYANLVRAGAKVYLTRDKDIYYTLKERAAMANGIGASIFVSVHNNSSTSPKPRGTETIYNTKINQEGKSEMELYGITSKTIAKNVQKEMIEALGTNDRGVKNRPELGVVRMTRMPAIIVEGAFLSNEEDFSLIKQPEFSDKYAEAVAKGLIKSMNEAYK